jgi:hypothetical protein
MVTEIGKISEVTEAAGPKMTIEVPHERRHIQFGGSLCVCSVPSACSAVKSFFEMYSLNLTSWLRVHSLVADWPGL